MTINLKEKFNGQVYCITCFERSLNRGTRFVAGKMLGAGVRLIQYREKYRSDREKYDECLWLRKVTKKYGAILIVNDNPALAVACGADGLHLGQDDLPVPAARKLLKKNMFIGVSTHSPLQARKAVKEGADYIGVGPVFKTDTKSGVCKPAGLEYVRYVSRNINLPFVAIGGIKEHNIAGVIRAGATCICLVTEITESKDIKSKISRIIPLLSQEKG